MTGTQRNLSRQILYPHGTIQVCPKVAVDLPHLSEAPISNSATGVQTNEMVLGANDNIHVYRGVDFRPDAQYIIPPNAQSNIHNTVVFGFKASVGF
jgi:Carbohydrate-selective porin, OprB family